MAVYYKVVRNLIAKGNNWKIISSPYGKRLCHAIICRFNYIRVQQHFSLKLPQVISLSFTVCLLSIRSHRTSKYNCAFSLNKPCEKFQINCVHISLAISNWIMFDIKTIPHSLVNSSMTIKSMIYWWE